jgi:hypothetical protein
LLPAGAVAGWDSHPLESAALSRRTPTADIQVRSTGRFLGGIPFWHRSLPDLASCDGHTPLIIRATLTHGKFVLYLQAQAGLQVFFVIRR